MFWALFAILNVLATWHALMQPNVSFLFGLTMVVIAIPTTLCLVGYAGNFDVLPPAFLRPFCWVLGCWCLFSGAYFCVRIIQTIPADAGAPVYYFVGGFVLLTLLVAFLQWFGVWRYTVARA